MNCFLPRFSRSIALLLPAYVGRISLPISSITESKSVYVLWEPWAPGGFIACKINSRNQKQDPSSIISINGQEPPHPYLLTCT